MAVGNLWTQSDREIMANGFIYLRFVDKICYSSISARLQSVNCDRAAANFAFIRSHVRLDRLISKQITQDIFYIYYNKHISSGTSALPLPLSTALLVKVSLGQLGTWSVLIFGTNASTEIWSSAIMLHRQSFFFNDKCICRRNALVQQHSVDWNRSFKFIPKLIFGRTLYSIDFITIIICSDDDSTLDNVNCWHNESVNCVQVGLLIGGGPSSVVLSSGLPRINPVKLVN